MKHFTQDRDQTASFTLLMKRKIEIFLALRGTRDLENWRQRQTVKLRIIYFLHYYRYFLFLFLSFYLQAPPFYGRIGLHYTHISMSRHKWTARIHDHGLCRPSFLYSKAREELALKVRIPNCRLKQVVAGLIPVLRNNLWDQRKHMNTEISEWFYKGSRTVMQSVSISLSPHNIAILT